LFYFITSDIIATFVSDWLIKSCRIWLLVGICLYESICFAIRFW